MDSYIIYSCGDSDNYDGDEDDDGGLVNITASNVVRVFVRLDALWLSVNVNEAVKI